MSETRLIDRVSIDRNREGGKESTRQRLFDLGLTRDNVSDPAQLADYQVRYQEFHDQCEQLHRRQELAADVANLALLNSQAMIERFGLEKFLQALEPQADNPDRGFHAALVRLIPDQQERIQFIKDLLSKEKSSWVDPDAEEEKDQPQSRDEDAVYQPERLELYASALMVIEGCPNEVAEKYLKRHMDWNHYTEQLKLMGVFINNTRGSAKEDFSQALSASDNRLWGVYREFEKKVVPLEHELRDAYPSLRELQNKVIMDWRTVKEQHLNEWKQEFLAKKRDLIDAGLEEEDFEILIQAAEKKFQEAFNTRLRSINIDLSPMIKQKEPPEEFYA